MKQVILITGASRGLGAVLRQILSHNEAYHVYGTARNPENTGLLRLDVTDEASVKACIDGLLKKEGRIDVLINNVGSNLIGSLEATTLRAFRAQMDLNLYGAVSMIQRVMPVFRQQGHGKIINISSLGGPIPLPYNSAYSAAKAGLEAMSESLAYELTGSAIHVSLIEPLALPTGEETPRVGYVKEEKPWHGVSKAIHEKMLTAPKPSDKRRAVAKVVQRIIASPKPKLRYSVSLSGGLLLMAKRVLPHGLFRRMVYRAFVK